MCPCDQGCAYAIEGCQRISGVVSRKLLTNIRSNTIGILDYLMAVLVAISIPIFTTQLERSREATDMSNIRAAYAEAVADYLAKGATKATSAQVKTVQQQTKGWNISHNLYTRIDGKESKVNVLSIAKGDTVTVKVAANGKVTVS